MSTWYSRDGQTVSGGAAPANAAGAGDVAPAVRAHIPNASATTAIVRIAPTAPVSTGFFFFVMAPPAASAV
jgi:hypothetical protein